MSLSLKVFKASYDITCSLLPPQMTSSAAKAMLIAIALQESRVDWRRQIGGPARSFWQFEEFGGVAGVLAHRGSGVHIRTVLAALDYDFSIRTSYVAMEHNDILACAYARLLLWTVPESLPMEFQFDESWRQYISAWRPGKPHRETWDGFYKQAWGLSLGELK